MPPKLKFTREEVVNAALDAVREGGPEALTARGLAARLGCSAKPIFGLFENMGELRGEVLRAAGELYSDYISRQMESGEFPPYKASGMAYIRFARRERELFKLLFMRDRSEEDTAADDGSIDEIIAVISRNTGMSAGQARLFHLEMWIFVHGIATMIVTKYLDWDEEYISAALTDAYKGILRRRCGEAERESD